MAFVFPCRPIQARRMSIKSEVIVRRDCPLKGLAADGGLFVPEEIPSLPDAWESDWRNLDFEDLAFDILSLYISPSEIPPQDLQKIVKQSFSTFRHPKVTPLIELDGKKKLYLLELFHGRKYPYICISWPPFH